MLLISMILCSVIFVHECLLTKNNHIYGFTTKLQMLKPNVKPLPEPKQKPISVNANSTSINWCFGTSLHTIEPPGPNTALWSIPGSGNTWLRFLIQQATGYVTGAHKLYFEDQHILPSLPGGHLSNGSAIAVKDHLLYLVKRYHERYVLRFLSLFQNQPYKIFLLENIPTFMIEQFY